MQELYHYSIWKVQMLNCHYSGVWFSHLLFHMGILYIHILPKLSIHKDFWDLYFIHFATSGFVSTFFTIASLEKSWIFVAGRKDSHFSTRLHGHLWCLQIFFYLSGEFPDISASENSHLSALITMSFPKLNLM